MGYDSKGILVFNLKYEHAISFINLVKFINYYQMPRSISSKLFVIANVYGSSYYWNFRTSSFKQVACLILTSLWTSVLLTYICSSFYVVHEQLHNISSFRNEYCNILSVGINIIYLLTGYEGIASLLSPRHWLLTEARPRWIVRVEGTTNLLFPNTQSISILLYRKTLDS